MDDNGTKPLVNSNLRRLLNAREAAEYLGISKNTLYRMEKDGHIVPFRTPGGHRRYKIDMLDSYLESSRKKPG